MFFISPKKLKELGIVGMNKRNVQYIAEHNPRHLFPLVDDKLKTKMLAEKAGLSVPKLIGVMRVQKHVKELIPFMKDYESFVIKPAKGSGGKGILVIAKREGSDFITANGQRLTENDLHRHSSNILSGLYSLGGRPDVAMIEEKISFSETFNGFSYQGVPDLRIIVFRGYPTLAMARLSTSNSGGKANLHQGAIGVGIDISTGRAIHAIQHGLPLAHHPDTGLKLTSLSIPNWRNCLLQAAKCYDVTGLGYLGADIVLDIHKEPLILELNARPGLAIQVANGIGLQKRLDSVEEEIIKKTQAVDKQKSQESTENEVESRVNFSIQKFS